MQYDLNTVQRLPGGQTADDVAGALRSRIASGEVAPGALLPGVRRLAAELRVSSQTAHRALKRLAAEGLLSAEPSRGYRVLARANDPSKGCPVAFILETFAQPGEWGGSTRLVLEALNKAGEARGWPVVGLTTGERTTGELLQQLRSSRASGAALDAVDQTVIEAVREAGIPAVQVNAWTTETGIDSVMQDGQMGGLLAARYFAEKGCRRVAWIGRYRHRAHTMDRLSGAMIGCDFEGLRLPASRIVKLGADDQLERARRLLAGKDRPDGVIAPFMGATEAVATAARELKLTIGRDFQLVGWCVEEAYEDRYRSIFRGRPVAPAITWSSRVMAETTLSRLAERRANPELLPVRVKIPVKLRLEER
jgi:DNA-binding LacI/PurR family transcriptional regulator